MKLNAEAFGLLRFNGLEPRGGTVGGAIFVPDYPTAGGLQSDLAAKLAVEVSYVNTKLGSYPGFVFTSGTISIDRLPEFTGDLLRSVGSNVCSIATLPLTIGNFAKVTVNSKGLITSGSGIDETDVPNLDWNKISLNRPTTLGGYGITNGLTIDGGTMFGPLTIAVSSDPEDLVNKEVLDNIIAGEYIKPGQIVKKTNTPNVQHFLKCNGAEPRIVDYPNLYSAIGDIATIKISPGCGLPHLLQFEFNSNTSSTGNWTTGTAFPININRGKTLVTKNRVYVIGGASNTANNSSLNTIYNASIDPVTGIIGTWSLVGTIPVSLNSFELVMNVNNVYLIGGSNNGTDVSTIYRTTVNPDGTLNNWSLVGNLPYTLSSMSAFVSRNLLTIIGGSSGGVVSGSVIQTQINADGTLGIWNTCPDLTGKRCKAALFSNGLYVYLAGGQDDRSAAVSSVLRAPINADGTIGAWTAISQSLPTATQDISVFCTSGKVHLIGGGTARAGATRNRIYNATLNSDGTIGSWVTATNYPDQIRCTQIFITGTRIYTVGGYKSSTPSNAVRYFAFTGGLNDYTEYFSGSKRATDRGSFKLPDITSSLPGVESYIKT